MAGDAGAEAAPQVDQRPRLELLYGILGAAHDGGRLGYVQAVQEAQLDCLALLGGEAGEGRLDRLAVEHLAVLGAGAVLGDVDDDVERLLGVARQLADVVDHAVVGQAVKGTPRSTYRSSFSYSLTKTASVRSSTISSEPFTRRRRKRKTSGEYCSYS